MRPRVTRLAAIVVAATLLAGAVAADGAVRNPVREMSHYHPPGASYSFVCAHVKGKPGTRAIAKISGPAVAAQARHRFTFRRDEEGWYTLSWPIRSPGRYVLTLIDRLSGDRLDRDAYVVPSPPPAGKQKGPITCPIAHRQGRRG